ncbi:uncharacterized protein N0V89_011983 [Didymosphaeria variabile]|uniref:Uncharacterized protein n=1 Tax=Didymosphaeria variabile TaxID=1932322 RepID=A0A9W8XBK2_9PLEO|nr:uncharacterized protein N0V89_011983 [Didymosphaeria variabile]KAJ4345848.1 hypothetical protein N0V89_011983 [Didymosphaeria variabile]
MTSHIPSHLRSWRVAVNTIFELVKRQDTGMLPIIPTILVLGVSVSAAYLFFKKINPSASTTDSKKIPGDSEFIASIIEKRERTAREAANKLNKLKSVETEADDEFEDLPDSHKDRRARNVWAGKKYSHWAGQARTRRKLAAARRRVEALDKEREIRMGSEAGASVELEKALD